MYNILSPMKTTLTVKTTFGYKTVTIDEIVEISEHNNGTFIMYKRGGRLHMVTSVESLEKIEKRIASGGDKPRINV